MIREKANGKRNNDIEINKNNTEIINNAIRRRTSKIQSTQWSGHNRGGAFFDLGVRVKTIGVTWFLFFYFFVFCFALVSNSEAKQGYSQEKFEYYGSYSYESGPQTFPSRGVVTTDMADAPQYLYIYFSPNNIVKLDEEFRKKLVKDLRYSLKLATIAKDTQFVATEVIREYPIKGIYGNTLSLVIQTLHEGQIFNIFLAKTNKGKPAPYGTDGLFYFTSEESVQKLINLLDDSGEIYKKHKSSANQSNTSLKKEKNKKGA